MTRPAIDFTSGEAIPAPPPAPSAPAATMWEPWFIPLPKSAMDDPWWRLMVGWLAAVSGH